MVSDLGPDRPRPSLVRRVATLLGVLFVLVVASAVVAPAAGAAPASTTAAATAPTVAAAPAATNPLSNLNACLVERKAGDVIIMLDESGSVKGNDPTGSRVDAANALVAGLVQRIADPTSEIAGAKLDVSVANFGEQVFQNGVPVTPAEAHWSTLDAAGLPAIQQNIESYRNVYKGKETDYWTALDWIIKAQEAHTGVDTANGCHLVFWFTDGAPLIDPRDRVPSEWGGVTTKITPWTPTGVSEVRTQAEADAVRDGGINDICRPGGLADQLRSDKMVLAAVGLGGRESQFDLLKRIAVNPTGDCGKLPGIGVFDHADVATLLLLVEGLGDSSTFLDTDQQPVCERTPCKYAHAFNLDSSLRKVHIVGVPSVPGLQVQVKAPSGRTATIKPVNAGTATQPATVAVDGIDLRYQWVSDRELTIDMVRPDDTTNWTGRWSVTFIDTTGDNPKAVAATRVSLSADLALNATPPAPTTAQAGENLVFGLRLTSLSGDRPVVGSPPPTMIGTITLTPATPGAAAVPVASGPVDKLTGAGVSWPVPTGITLGRATVQLSLKVTTVTGIRLDPVVRQFSLTVGPAKGFPTVSDTLLNFGTVEGTGSGTTTMAVKGPGCVWVSSGDLVAHPAAVKAVAIGGPAASGQTCQTLAAGETRQLTVTATPGDPANGAVRGTVVVHLAPDGHPDRAATQAVPYTMTLERQAAAAPKWFIFAGALLLGIGLPILVLWLTRRIAARYPTDVQLVAARIPVLISTPSSGSGAMTGQAGGPPTLPDQWGAVPPPVDGRRTLLVEGVRLRARSGPLWSASPGYSETQDRVGTAAVAPFYGGKNFQARLPLGVQGTWSVLFRSIEELAGSATTIAGELLVITHPSTTPAARRALLAEATSQGPRLVAELRAAVRAAAGTTDQSGGPGTDPGGPGPGGPGPGGPGPGGPPVDPGPWGSQGQQGGPGPNQPPPVPGWDPQPTPSWGAEPAGRPAPGWGSEPTGQPAPGWGSEPTGQPAPGWGSEPGRPAPGWGAEPAGQPAPGWSVDTAGQPVSGWGAEPPSPSTSGRGAEPAGGQPPGWPGHPAGPGSAQGNTGWPSGPATR